MVNGDRGNRTTITGDLPAFVSSPAFTGNPVSLLLAILSGTQELTKKEAPVIPDFLAYNLTRISDESGTHELRNGWTTPAVPDFLSSRLYSGAHAYERTASASYLKCLFAAQPRGRLSSRFNSG